MEDTLGPLPELKHTYGSIPTAELADDPESHRQHSVGETVMETLHDAGEIIHDAGGAIIENLHEFTHEIVEASFILEGDNCSVHTFEGHATRRSEIANMTKNLVGCGVLSLPGGIAMFSSSPRAVLAATFWIVLLGTIVGYFCLLIGKVCKLTRSATYRECWEGSIGDWGGTLVSCCNALKAALANLAYSTILSQTFRSLFQTVGIELSNIQCLLIITIVGIFPLCLLKSLHVLAPFSVIGTAGIIMTAVAMVVRYSDGSYQAGGEFYDDLSVDLKPTFGHRNLVWSVQILPFICMLFEAFIMHYNSPRYYAELKQASIPRFATVVAWSFGLAAMIFVTMACAGYLTFGSHCDGFILNNYSPHDPLATLSRLAIAFSTLLTYPLVFMGFRDGVLDILEVPAEKQTSSNVNVLTIVLLSIITLIACFVSDLGLINAVGGGTLAAAIVFIFPALMYRQAVKDRGDRATSWQHREVIIALALMVFGVTLGIAGTWEALG